MTNHTNNKYNIKVISKEDTILNSLYDFYKEPDYIKQILPIITGVSKLSLRTLDWFVTNYAKKYEISYEINKNNKQLQFVVHSDYKSQLKAYNKRFFDPFCRENKNNKKNRIPFKYNEDKYILTTSGKELVYHTTDINKSRKKYDDDMVEKIFGYKNSYILNKTDCIKKIKLELNIKIGLNTLKKIMEKSY